MTNFSSSTFRKFVFVFNNHLQHVFIEKYKSDSTWIYLALPTGPSASCVMLQTRVGEGVGQSADQALPFFHVKDE